MAEELKIRVTGDTTQAVHAFEELGNDAATNIKKLQAAIASVRADKLGADFIGAKEDAEAFKKSIQALNVTLAENKAKKAFEDLGNEGRGSSRIIKEAFTTVSSEIIESWGVDGDIANELGKMFVKLPKNAIIAGVGIAAAFVTAAVAIGGVILTVEKMIDVAGEVGTKSKDDFDKFAKSAKAAGVEITNTDRALSQELLRSAESVKAAFDGLFVQLIREAGPELNALLRQTAKFLTDLAPIARAFGSVLAEAFLLGAAAEKTFIEGMRLIAMFLANPTGFGLAAIGPLIELFRNNLDQLRGELSKPLPNPTFDSKEKGPDREKARERAAELLQKMLNEARRDEVIKLKDIDALRFATDEYSESLRAKIELFRGFMALGEGQSKRFTELAKQGIAAAKDVRDLQFETAEIELKRLSTFADNEIVIAQARAELERQQANDHYDAVRERIAFDLEANRAQAGDDQATAAQKLRNQQTLNALLEEEQKRHLAVLDEIKREEAREVERRTPNTARNLFGDAFADELQKSGSRVRAFAASVRESMRQSSAEVGNFGTIGTRALNSFAAGLGEVVRNFVLTGQTGPAALRKLTTAVLAEVAQQAAVKAIFELAEGFALLFINPAAAGAHFTAAALYGSVAGVAAIAGRAIAPASSAAGGGALGNQLASNSAGNNQTNEERIRFTERDGHGIAQGNVIITLVTDQAQTVKNVEMATVKSYRQRGAIKQVLDNHVSGIPITTAG